MASANPRHPGSIGPHEFARLLEANSRALWCVAAGVLGDRDMARDVVQESAIKGLQKLDEFTPGTSFVHWMGQIVRFTALNMGRRRHLRSAQDIDSAGEIASRGTGGSVSESVEGAFDDQTLAALSTLEETARTCLLMRTVLDMPYRQISEALGIAEGTAMSHVHRSRQRLREAILRARAVTPKGGR